LGTDRIPLVWTRDAIASHGFAENFKHSEAGMICNIEPALYFDDCGFTALRRFGHH
jgi:hypothetical protein